MLKKQISVYAQWFTLGQRWHHLVRLLLQRGHSVTVYTPRSLKHLRNQEPLRNLGTVPSQRLHLVSALQITPKLVGRRLANHLNHRSIKALQRRFFRSKADLHIYSDAPPETDFPFEGRLWFDVVDDYRDSPWAAPTVEADEHRLSACAEILTGVSKPITHRLAQVHGPKVSLIPNGAFVEHFQGVPSLRNARPRHKVMGYMGCISYWFDGALLASILESNPEWVCHLAGTLTLPPEELTWLHHPRIHYAGRLPFDALPEFLSQVAVGIIPFKKDRIVDSTSPIKLYEYLASGIPVVSTDMPDVQELSGHPAIFAASGSGSFLSALEKAFSTADAATCQDLARQHGWERRFQPIFDLLDL